MNDGGDLIISEGCGEHVELFERQVFFEILGGFGERAKFLVGSAVAIERILFTNLAFVIDGDFSEGARAVIVEIPFEPVEIKVVDLLGMRRIDKKITEPFADHGTVLGFRQAVVVRMPRPGFGQPDEKPVQ